MVLLAIRFESKQLQMSFNPTANDLEGASSDDLRFNDTAFEAFFKEHYPQLCLYCKFKFDFDIELAEDVVNTSFIKLWEVRQTLAADVSPKSYLYKIINNTSLNILKHEKIKHKYAQEILKTTSEVIEESSFDRVDLRQLRADIDTGIAELPEQMRRIFELSRFESLKYTEIAYRLNISVKTVETQMSRALTKLREKLSRYLTSFLIVLFLSLLIKK
jgi:RNA polymerase sigma-70 factor, ECF subfamily